MRFRLGTLGTSGAQQAADGIGRGFQAFFSAPLIAAQASSEANKEQSQEALRAAQTALYGQKAEAQRQQLARGSLPELIASAALTHGVPLHQVPEVSKYFQTGQLPGQYTTPVDGVGPTMPAPDYANNAGLGGQIMKTLGLMRGALTVGDKSIENVAKAGGELQDQSFARDAAVAAGRGDDMMMSRLNTIRGKREFTPFKAVGNTGTALNEVTGQQDVSNPDMRALFGGVQNASINRDNAAAQNSRALAGMHNLQAPGAATADGTDDSVLSNDTVRFMAQQYLKGDQSVLTNLGRGAQGAKNVVRLRNAIRLEAEAAGMDPSQVASAVAMFQGDKAAFRAAGTRGAQVEMAATEADKVADLALEASVNFGRTGFVPVNKAIRAWQTNTGDPDVVKFGAANNALINTYARAISPTGVPTVHDKQHAEDLLSTAFDQRQYAAVVNQMKQEIAAAKASPGTVRESMATRLGTRPGASAPSAAADPLGLRRK